MTPEQIQFLFDSAIRSQFAWRRKAAQLYRVGIRTLQSAADAKDPAQAINTGESRTLTSEEMEAFEEFNLYEVGFFLIALSVENLLKAIWAGKNHARFTGITNIPRELDGLADHDLARLARSADVAMSDYENALLNDLRDCIMWSGRYPTPLRVEEYGQAMTNGAPTNRFISGNSIYTIDLPLPAEVDALFGKLMDEIQAIPGEQTY